MKRLIYIFVIATSLFPVGCYGAIHIKYTLPVYELQNSKQTNQLAAICESCYGRYNHPDYYLIASSRWADTIFSTYTGETLSIYNSVIQGRNISYHAYGEKDFCKSLLGCCPVGDHWIMMKDSATLKNLFKPTEKKQTFRRKLTNICCYCMEQRDCYYIGGDTIVWKESEFDDEACRLRNLDEPIFHFEEASNPNQAAAEYYRPKADDAILYGWVYDANRVFPDSIDPDNFFESNTSFPQEAPDSIVDYSAHFRLVVEKDGRISNVVFQDARVKGESIAPIECFSNEIRRVAAILPPLAFKYDRGRPSRYVIEMSCYFRRKK